MFSKWATGACSVLALLAVAVAGADAARVMPQQRSAGDDLIPMGTTVGERYDRLVIRNATVVSGRGTPGTNRACRPKARWTS